jgi:hypothetical protein
MNLGSDFFVSFIDSIFNDESSLFVLNRWRKTPHCFSGTGKKIKAFSFGQLNNIECKPPKLKVMLENVESSGLSHWELQREEFSRIFRRV